MMSIIFVDTLGPYFWETFIFLFELFRIFFVNIDPSRTYLNHCRHSYIHTCGLT